MKALPVISCLITSLGPATVKQLGQACGAGITVLGLAKDCGDSLAVG